MLIRFASAFFLIFLGRYVYNFTDWSLIVRQDLTILLRAVASYMLIIASLNGTRKSEHTNMWLAFFLFVAVATQWISGGSVPAPLSIGPISFALSLGWFFAAWKFLFDTPTIYEDCSAYEFLGGVFAIRGITAVLGSNPSVPASWLVWVGLVDLISLALLLLGGIILAFQRHRVIMDCQRIPGDPTS
jgi:hypothetical protein